MVTRQSAVLPKGFDEWLGLEKAAAELRIHTASLRRKIKAKKAQATLFGGAYFIHVDEVKRLKAELVPRQGRKPAPRLL